MDDDDDDDNNVSKTYHSNCIIGEREDEVRQALKDLRTAGTYIEELVVVRYLLCLTTCS